MYSFIINPYTNKKYNINSKKGILLLDTLIHSCQNYQKGGSYRKNRNKSISKLLRDEINKLSRLPISEDAEPWYQYFIERLHYSDFVEEDLLQEIIDFRIDYQNYLHSGIDPGEVENHHQNRILNSLLTQASHYFEKSEVPRNQTEKACEKKLKKLKNKMEKRYNELRQKLTEINRIVHKMKNN